MDLRGVGLSEKSQSQQFAYCVIPFRYHSQNDENGRDGEQVCGCRGLGWVRIKGVRVTT